jgi:protein tyrosine/serine phosphatase
MPILLLTATIAAALSAGFWLWRHYFDLYHLATVNPNILYRDGVRDPAQFATAIRKIHPKTIVSLVDDTEITQEPFTSEVAFCHQNNITLIRIPVLLGGWPTSDQIKQFLTIASNPQNHPVLIHCAQGVRRTGMFVAAYQESILKFDRHRTKTALLTFGHSQRTVGDVERFIDLYDPDSASMTAYLPRSVE